MEHKDLERCRKSLSECFIRCYYFAEGFLKGYMSGSGKDRVDLAVAVDSLFVDMLSINETVNTLKEPSEFLHAEDTLLRLANRIAITLSGEPGIL